MDNNPPESAFTCEIQVRWEDTDMAGHVNNAKYVTWLEAARIEWWKYLRKNRELPRFRGIMAHVDIDYKKEVNLSNEVFVSLWQKRIGTKSYTTSYFIHNQDRSIIYATASTVIVAYDFENEQSIPIPDWFEKILLEFA